MNPRKIAIFGGSFNPFHSGHHQIVTYLSKTFDEVVVIPTNMKYYKHECEMYSFDERCDEIEKRFAEMKNVRVDRVERNRPENWKFVHSLKHVIENIRDSMNGYVCGCTRENTCENMHVPACEFYVAMGSDCLQDFKNWYKWEEILSLAKLIVFTRPGCMNHIPEDIECTFVSMNNTESSTKIRKMRGFQK